MIEITAGGPGASFSSQAASGSTGLIQSFLSTQIAGGTPGYAYGTRASASRRTGFILEAVAGCDVAAGGRSVFLGFGVLSHGIFTASAGITGTTGGRIGFGAEQGGNWSVVVSSVPLATPTLVDLGANFAAASQDAYQLVCWCAYRAIAGSANPVTYFARNLRTGVYVSGTVSANLPDEGDLLHPGYKTASGATIRLGAFRGFLQGPLP